MKYLVEIKGEILVDTDALDYRQYVSDQKGLLPRGNKDDKHWVSQYAKSRIQVNMIIREKKE